MNDKDLLTICSVVISNNLGPNIAGAKNRRKINPLMTEYLTSLFFGKCVVASSLKHQNISHIKGGHRTPDVVIAVNTLSTYSYHTI